jgi:hypothetical protein
MKAFLVENGNIKIQNGVINMSPHRIRHNNDKGKKVLERLPDSEYRLNELRSGSLQEDLCREEHSSQQSPVLPFEQVCDDVRAMHHGDHDLCSRKINFSHNDHSIHSESSKQYELWCQEILQILSTAPPPPKEFYWIPDSDHFALYYRNRYKGIIIYGSPNIGAYRISLTDRELISLPTLRQAQAICHTTAWIFRGSLPVQNNCKLQWIIYQTDKRKILYISHFIGLAIFVFCQVQTRYF